MERRKAHSSRQLRTQHEKIKFLFKKSAINFHTLLCLQLLLLLLHIIIIIIFQNNWLWRYVQFIPEIHQTRDALGGHWGVPNTPIPCRKSAKYRYGIHAYLQKLYPSRVFVYLKDLCKSRESTSPNARKRDLELSRVYI